MRNKSQPGVDLFLKTIISLFFIVEFALAIDTGKLAGRVLDKETGDPLAGANVMILETYMGSAADVDGGYLILNIPPGKYKVRAEVIGYSAMNVLDVLITGDLTTTIDFPLASTVLESDEVVVLAERPLIQADQTSSRRTITSDELLNMPVTSIESAVAYTAGAVNSGGLHFRGGRTSEVIYILDGIPIKDPWTGNSNDTNVPLLSISEANVITSGFGAEYGDAQSGIIELTSKEGRNTFSGNVRINSSNPLSGEPTFESPYESNTVEFALSGPILKDKFHFSIIGEQQNKSGRFRNQRNEMLSYTGRLSYKINDKLKLSFSGLYTKTDLDDGFTYSYSHMISEDLHTGFMPSYVKGFDDLISPISDGIIQDGEVPSFYTDWWTTAGLQTEDADGDGILDLYIEYEPFADWNENGQYDEGEWYNDINGNGVYDNSPYEQDRDATGQLIDPDGDGANEDYNNNFVLDTEGALDSWYGNGILDTEDTNGNGVLDAGEDLNGNGIIDAEDVDQDGKITEFNMFERRPLWQDESHMWNAGLTWTLSKNTFLTFRVAQYSTMLQSNIVERINEDTDRDGVLDIYWATEPFEDVNGDGKWNDNEWFGDINGNNTYDEVLDWDVDGDNDKRNEDLNGNGILDTYTPDKPITGIDDPQDMFHDKNNNDYVDESERDWNGDGVIDEYDQNYFWMPWADIPDEGFKHHGNFYGVSPANPYTYNRDHWHFDEKVMTTYKADLVSQINSTNQIRSGLEYIHYNMQNHWPPDRYGYAENDKSTPTNVALYITDKMEYKGIIVNAGLRMEYFKPNTASPADESDPTWTSNDYADWDDDGKDENYKQWRANAGLYTHALDDIKNPVDADNKLLIAPRLGISFPISDKSLLYFNYGRQYQRPALSYLFRNNTYNFGGGFPIVGNPNMDPELTTAYEVGVRRELPRELLLEGKGFYKDIFGLADTRPIYWTVSDWYTTYYNRDYGNVRGFEIVLVRRPGKLLYGEMNYTYSIAKGKSSSVGQGYLTEWSGNIVPTFESYLAWDQTHTFNLNSNVAFKGILATFFMNYGSGTRYTKPNQGRLIVENTETYPWFLSSNFRLSYSRKIAGTNLGTYLYVTNLFDMKRFRGVADREWYHQFKGLVDTYDENGDGKVTLADGQDKYFEYMGNVDLDHDGKIDKNKLNPEQGAHLNPTVYQDQRRMQVGFTVSF